MSEKHIFCDWLEVEAGYGKARSGFKPANASPYGIKLKMHRPVFDLKSPAIIPEKPWECATTGAYATFLRADGKYKCWYEAYTKWDDYHISLCYAESDDGIKWTKPNLGLVCHNGSKENNILMADNSQHGYFVYFDESATSSERYKMVFTLCTELIDGKPIHYTCGAVSPDGIHWENLPPFFEGGDTQVCMTKANGKYIVYSKPRGDEIIHRRCIIWSESDDFRSFSEVRYIKTNEPLDPPDTDYYCIDAMKWLGCENAYVSLQTKYRRTGDYSEVYLETSRNGYEFRPVSYDAFVPNGEPPFDKFIMPSGGILDIGNGQWAVYINTPEYYHNDDLKTRTYPHGKFILGTLREDGFVSVNAESYGGFETMPLYFSGDTFLINADFSDCGYIKAEIIDSEDDKTVTGFEFQNCNSLKRGKIWQEVSWKSGKKISDLDLKRRYRIRFKLFMADIYAYKI